MGSERAATMSLTRMSTWPRATFAIFAVTTVCMVAQALEPSVLESLRREPGAIASGEYWRLITPALVHSGGWVHYAVNMTALLVAGVALERRIGAARLVVIYVAASVVGEIVGLAWKPHGAGASVGVAGLTGALAAVIGMRSSLAMRWTVAALAVALTAASVLARDVHGPPMLTGALLCVLLVRGDVAREGTHVRV